MLKNEINLFLTAVMFYTRIPCPSVENFREDDLNHATRYFPLIGYFVGGASTLGLYLSTLLLPISVSVVIALLIALLMTGAFHEDGFADVCDGFGGGWTKEKILEIMKDSRVGVYASVALIILFGLKITTMIELIHYDLWFAIKVILLAHVISRCSAVVIMFSHVYCREDESSKVKSIAKKLSLTNFLISMAWLIPIFLLFDTFLIVLIILPVLLSTICCGRYFNKWISGYTGDCLGATQQINETITLLFCLGLCAFI